MTPKPIVWSYGVTTIPSRMSVLLPKTLESLRKAGFDNPHLFIDGASSEHDKEISYTNTLSQRSSPLRAVGNWVLAAWELYYRSPYADRYVIFQDDCVAYKNLREYLEACPYPKNGYLSLYTWPWNYIIAKEERLIQNIPDTKKGIWYKSNQLGKGAVGLVFDNDAMRTLLSSPMLVEKPRHPIPKMAIINIDGMVIEAMRASGYMEYSHDPSLLQHTGIESSIGSVNMPIAPHWLGEDYNAVDLLRE